MQFIMKHFPFLFILVLLFSCHEKEKNKVLDSDFDYFIEEAQVKESINQLDSSYYYYNLAQSICKPSQKLEKIYCLLGAANIQKVKSDFIGAEETITEAFKILDSSKYNLHLYNLLGIVYKELKDYENALKYSKKILSYKNLEESESLIVKNNIAVIYLEQHNYNEAIKILKPLLSSKILKGNRIEYARVTDNLGFAYLKIKKDTIAKTLLEESLEIRDIINDDSQKIASYIHLSEYYKKNNPLLANDFAKKALQSATIVNSPDDKLEALTLLSDLSESSVSKSYFNDYIRINDSINFIRQTAKNQFAKIKYDSRLAIEEGENQKKQKIIYLLLFLVTVLSGVFIFYFIVKTNKEKLLKTAYTTETRISKRLHDELANDVFNTMTFIETQDLGNETNKESILQGLDAIYGKARSISKQTGEIKTGKEFSEQLNQLLMSYNSKEVNVIVKGSSAVDWEKIKANKQIEIYRTLSELLVNMKKHSQANLVLVSFESLEKTIAIQYKDNGVGFEKAKISKNGLQNVENRIQSIHGTITFESETNKGLKINIEFPK